MSSYQIGTKQGKQKDKEKRHRRGNEKKRVAMRKMAEKAQGARNSEGGIGPLDRGKQQLGGVRLWALTMDEEYMADPVPTNSVMVFEGGEEDLDGRKPHCLVRWAAAAERVLPCNFPEMEEEEEDENDEAAAVQTEAAAAADGSGSASEPEPARPKQLSDEDTLALLNSGGGGRQDREADPLHAFYVMDYSKVASELAGEKSSYQLGLVAKPIARTIVKLNPARLRLVASGSSCLLVAKICQQFRDQLSEAIESIVLILPELPGGLVRSWVDQALPPLPRPPGGVIVYGCGEQGEQYAASGELGWSTGVSNRGALNAIFEGVEFRPYAPALDQELGGGSFPLNPQQALATVGLRASSAGPAPAAADALYGVEIELREHFRADLKGGADCGSGLRPMFARAAAPKKIDVIKWLQNNVSAALQETHGVGGGEYNLRRVAKRMQLDYLLEVYGHCAADLTCLVPVPEDAPEAPRDFESQFGEEDDQTDFSDEEEYYDEEDEDIEEGEEEPEEEEPEAPEGAGSEWAHIYRKGEQASPISTTSGAEAALLQALFPDATKRAGVATKLAGLPPFERETALGRLKTAQQRRIGVPVGDDAGLLMAMYPDPARRSGITAKLAGMSEFERKVIMARMRESYNQRRAAAKAANAAAAQVK